MYLGVDIGGSKTLIATFNSIDSIVDAEKIKTPESPDELVRMISASARKLAGDANIDRAGVAVPGSIKDGYFTNTTTLGWADVPLQRMLEGELQCEVRMENDAVLGGLSEARTGNGRDCTHLLYITISTGVGTGIIVDKSIPSFLPGSEGGLMPLSSSGDTIQSRISGRAFKERFGKFGYEVDDPNIWDEYAKDLAQAILAMSALIEPSCVVIGGGMSVHYQKFEQSLMRHIEDMHNEQIPLPKIARAARPEDAVIYGCAILAIDGART